MVKFEILTGKQAGAQVAARRFPFVVGRSKGSNFTSEENGVWDRHFEVRLDEESIELFACSDANVLVNDQPVRNQTLKAGDTIAAGALKLRFWLEEAVQKNYWYCETLNYLLWAAVIAGQLWLLVHFLK